MFEVGDICVKTAGRDAGKFCIIIQKVDDIFVMIDGGTRRKKCNKRHLEPVNKKAAIDKDASHEKVVAELKKAGFIVEEKKKKEKGTKEKVKPKKIQTVKKKDEKPAPAKKAKVKK